MCGIYAYLGNTLTIKQIEQYAELIKHRGPDDSEIEQINDNLIFAFHRLAIMDVSNKGNQPLHLYDEEGQKTLSLICNGEIFNFEKLCKKYGFQMASHSDCEVILHLFNQLRSIKEVVSQLDGDFAFVIHDHSNGKTYVARDPIGVRPLFVGSSEDDLFFCSEAKSLCVGNYVHQISQFPPGSYWCSDQPTVYEKYFDLSITSYVPNNVTELYDNIENLFVKSVKKRMMSDRKVGCLLSGGLDSSLVAGTLCKLLNDPSKLETYSIGMEGSPDLHYAQEVANYLGTKHHTVTFTKEEGLNAIEDVIFAIESYDITTIRASIGMYLISKYIKENSDDVVIFSGEGSDEIAEGYLYFHKRPSAYEGHEESLRLVKDLCYFDVLRGDRTTAAHGLELRVPFLDKEFVKFYLSINPHLKQPIENTEKYILRKAFDGKNYIPDSVLWRRKEAFSDGVSGKEDSWFQILQKYIDTQITDYEFEYFKKTIGHNTPMTKEAYYYRKIYNKYYRNFPELIPYFWMPKWSNTTDPSARTLENYSAV